MRAGLALLVLIAFVGSVLASDVGDLLVNTTLGQVQGFVFNNSRAFLGIPYAAPPLGDLRWRPPQEAKAWPGVYQAFQYAKDCIQTMKTVYEVNYVSEDCLYLNVFTPLNTTSTDGLAVMVWINPGSFTGGSGHEWLGTQLMDQGNVVFVTFNHRVNVFGYLALPALINEDPATGNYGMQDQRAALQWVQQNIRAFGGDPSRVTLFGESSGGISVCWHLAAPKSRGLFSRAIQQSGFCDMWTLSKSQSVGKDIAKNVSCTQPNPADQLACLRSMPAWTLLNASTSQGYMLPTVDGVEMPKQPWALLEAGQCNVPEVMMGATRNEAGFMWSAAPNATWEQVELMAVMYYGPVTGAEVIAHYRTRHGIPVEALVNIITQGTFVCPTKQAARSIASNNGTVYLYSFAHTPGWSTPLLGAEHTFELPFIFHDLLALGWPWYHLTPAELELSYNMVNYWTSFANNGVPMGPVQWPKYEFSTDQDMALNLTMSVEAHYMDGECAFWDKINTKNPGARANAADWFMQHVRRRI